MTSVRYGRARKRVKVAHRMTPYDYALRSIIITGEKGERDNILEGEALFENALSRSKYMASQRHVHSDLELVNGEAITNDTELGKALKNLRFAGFAVTGFDQKYGVYEQGFMATIGGVNTVMNTGEEMINTGQVVYVIPVKTDSNKQLHPSIKGVVRSKRLAATVTENSSLFVNFTSIVFPSELIKSQSSVFESREKSLTQECVN